MEENREKMQRELIGQIRSSQTVAGLLPLFIKIAELEASTEITPREAGQLKTAAVNAFESISSTETDTTTLVMCRFVVPWCVNPTSGDDATINSHLLRERLAKWIEKFDQEHKTAVRDAVISTLLGELEHDDRFIGACRTIGKIGYRTSEIVDRLLRYAQILDDKGLAALGTLLDLGVPRREQARIEVLARGHIAVKSSKSASWLVEALPVPESLKTALQQLASDACNTFHDSQIWLAVVVRILKKLRSNDLLFDMAWGEMTQICQAKPEIANAVKLMGSFPEVCFSVKIVPSLLSMLASDKEDAQAGRHRRYVTYLRLGECNEIRQLAGWDDKANYEAMEVLRRDACFNCRDQGRYKTIEMHAKESAWETLLYVGDPKCVEWIDEAISGEPNGYVIENVLNSVGCVGSSVLPSTVIQLVTERYKFERGGDPQSYVSRTAAIQFACSAATLQSFDTILRFGLTLGDDDIFLGTAQALSDVALALVEGGTNDIVNRLFDVALSHDQNFHRIAAVAALRHLALNRKLFDASASERLLLLAEDASLNGYARTVALEAIGLLDIGAMNESMIDRVVALGRVNAVSGMNWRAIEVLARQRQVRIGDEQTSLEAEIIRGWFNRPAGELETWQIFIIGILFTHDADGYLSNVCSIISDADEVGVFQLLHLIVRMELPSAARGRVASAVLKRIKRTFTEYAAELRLLRFLGRLSPGLLVAERWKDCWGQWIPESRAALADALGELSGDESLIESACRILVALLDGGTFGVRRSAYRAIANLAVCLTPAY